MYVPGTDLGGLQASLGGIRLGGVDDAGVAWVLQSVEGWDSAEIRSEVQQREADHGAWHSPAYFGARPITLTGTIVAPDRAALDEAFEQMRAAVGLADTLLVVWETVPKQAIVRRSGRPLLQYLTDQAASYSVMVTAADPRRYGIEEQAGFTGLPSSTGGLVPPLTPPLTLAATTVSGEISATNIGSIATRPVFTVDGPVAQPQILVAFSDSTVKVLAYGETLAAGEQLIIDTDAKSVILNGSASRRRYLSAQWPEIPAKDTISIHFQAAIFDSGALLTARWRSAWM